MALLTGVALLAVVLAIPGFGLGGRLKTLITGSNRPGLNFETTLTRPDGTSVGSFSMHTSRIFITLGPRSDVVPHPFAHRGEALLEGVPLTWRLDLTRSARATAARLERRTGRHRLIARLCRPCSRQAKGVLSLRRAG